MSYGPASVSASWSSGTDIAREGLAAYAFGISGTLTSSAHSSVQPQLGKSAQVEGDLGQDLKPDTIYAVFHGESCGYSEYSNCYY